MNAAHGTYAGYNEHHREGTSPCAECRAAANAYHKKWRKKGSAGAQRERDMQNAASRARWRLAKLHPDEYQALLAEEVLASDPATVTKKDAS